MSIAVTDEQRVLEITLNRPDKRNALSASMCQEIVKAVQSAQKRKDIGAILIGSAGRAFCAGMDLDEAAGMEEDSLAALHEDLFTMGAGSLKPIVMCVNGPALGGGLGLVAQGHVVVAGDGSTFGLPEIRLGLWPFLVYRAVETALGVRRTLEMSLTGRVIHAQDALNWGMAHYLYPNAEAGEKAKALAREIAKASPVAVAAGMQYRRNSRGKSWEESGQLAKELRQAVMQGADFKEGYDAFKQKREPRWPEIPPDFYTRAE